MLMNETVGKGVSQMGETQDDTMPAHPSLEVKYCTVSVKPQCLPGDRKVQIVMWKRDPAWIDAGEKTYGTCWL